MKELRSITAAPLIELPGKKEIAGVERLGNTLVRGFDGFEFINNRMIVKFLGYLPTNDLVHCKAIEMAGNNQRLVKTAVSLLRPSAGEITVFPNHEKGVQFQEKLYIDITRHVARLRFRALENDNPERTRRWINLHEASQQEYEKTGFGMVSSQAAASTMEDFAHTYQTYLFDPYRLAILCPEKYEFMRVHIFFGKEYPGLFFGEVTMLGAHDDAWNRLWQVLKKGARLDGIGRVANAEEAINRVAENGLLSKDECSIVQTIRKKRNLTKEVKYSEVHVSLLNEMEDWRETIRIRCKEKNRLLPR